MEWSRIIVIMNRLSTADRAKIIQGLCDGNSIRATCRITGAAKNTVTKLLVELGCACAEYHHEHVRGVRSRRIQCD